MNPVSTPTAAVAPMAPAATPQSSLPLADIHLPEPVSFWPLAPGWWLLAGLILLAAIAIGWWFYHHQPKERQPRFNDKLFRQQLQQQLDSAWQTLQQQPDQPQHYLVQLQTVLKLFARQFAPARLSHFGNDWSQWLQACKPGQFSDSSLQLLSEGLYLPPHLLNNEELAQLHQQAVGWLQQADVTTPAPAQEKP
ncbi:DUF4381 domain-containing protein [Oceanobacter mangrovi]|uniref:DUF4381 domain-containing protein n=1 Tax=Oceanobacter mangrovi TaxID=2862510 RepID=UPI001C8E9A56|nr:DUF4381 domain-containing protein [Oceanobacter mangrovi]